MGLLRPVIERYAQRQLARIRRVQPLQPVLHPWPHHWAHGVGQHKHLIARRKADLDHLDHLGVHEGLATGEPDLAHAPFAVFKLFQIVGHLVSRQIDQPIIARRRLDIAIHAFDVAQRAGVKPKRLGVGQRNPRALFALGRDLGMLEFSKIFGAFDRVFHA